MTPEDLEGHVETALREAIDQARETGADFYDVLVWVEILWARSIEDEMSLFNKKKSVREWISDLHRSQLSRHEQC